MLGRALRLGQARGSGAAATSPFSSCKTTCLSVRFVVGHKWSIADLRRSKNTPPKFHCLYYHLWLLQEFLINQVKCLFYISFLYLELLWPNCKLCSWVNKNILFSILEKFFLLRFHRKEFNTWYHFRGKEGIKQSSIRKLKVWNKKKWNYIIPIGLAVPMCIENKNKDE